VEKKYASECYNGKFIGADYGIAEDLSNFLSDNWKDFNARYIPIWLNINTGKTKVAAGLSCGQLWTISKGMNIGDIILCPDGMNSYFIGEITSEYYYQKGKILPHRRNVKWFDGKIARNNMSEQLKNSTGSLGTVCDITKYSTEVEAFFTDTNKPKIVATDSEIEDPSNFVLEKHLEEFLIENWSQTELGKQYDIYTEDGEIIGQQFATATGPIDILAISKDKKALLVVELKKGRASDKVIGQIQRYMGFVKEELAEDGQEVKGVIIALDDDKSIKYALSVANNIDFYRYRIDFKLIKT
jgi:restriction system protein